MIRHMRPIRHVRVWAVGTDPAQNVTYHPPFLELIHSKEIPQWL